MKPASLIRVTLSLAIAAYSAACASSTPSNSAPPPVANMSTSPPSPDPRIGLAPGTMTRWAKDTTKRVIATPAAEAIWNLRLVSNTPSAEPFTGVTNSDLAFSGKYVFQGNYNGYAVWDVSNAESPKLAHVYLCPASQSDVSVFGDLLFVSGEGQTGRLDCGTQGVPEPVSTHRLRGIRIFDISDVDNPKYVANVQTCRGSHTHTVVSDPNDKANVYIYVSGSSGVRSPQELPGCLDAPIEDPNSARFRIEVIKVPLADPTQAKIVSSPRIFHDLTAPPVHAPPPTDTIGRGNRARPTTGAPPAARGGPNQCHDITVYPAVGLAGGACGGYGLLLDIRDIANPKRLYAAADSNFSYWHSATFSNDGKRILFTDEWGGGSAPRCRATDKYEWGANALFTIENNQLVHRSYYKMPAAQTTLENCVAHNGSLIPIPGREVMVQGWYQGGISIFDWTDPSKPFEIAFHDRGPIDKDRQGSAGSWSVYWYNGKIYSSEIGRGLDIFELVPSGFISQNEIDAAKTVRWKELNAQEQPKMEWPATFSLARAYLDQLERNRGLSADRIAAIRNGLTAAEKQKGSSRSATLKTLANEVHGDAQRASDAPRVHTVAAVLEALAR